MACPLQTRVMTVNVCNALASRRSTKRPTERIATQNIKSQKPRMIPAMVRLPIRQTFGRSDARTLSVEEESAKKSPATIIITIRSGVRTAPPVRTNPLSRNRT